MLAPAAFLPDVPKVPAVAGGRLTLYNTPWSRHGPQPPDDEDDDSDDGSVSTSIASDDASSASASSSASDTSADDVSSDDGVSRPNTVADDRMEGKHALLFHLEDRERMGTSAAAAHYAKRQKRLRRHASLAILERRVDAAKLSLAQQVEAKRAARRAQREARVAAQAEDKASKAFSKMVRDRGAKAVEAELAARNQLSRNAGNNLRAIQEAGIVSGNRRDAAAEAAGMVRIERFKREKAARDAAAARAVAAVDRQRREEETAATQHIQRMMRRAGVLPGVNPVGTDDPPDQQEFATNVILRGTPLEAVKAARKAERHFRSFNIDLRRFRNIEVLKAERIGERGGRALARCLAAKAANRMHTLVRFCLSLTRHPLYLPLTRHPLTPTPQDLGFCEIRRRGADSLFGAFSGGAGGALVRLELRNNGLPPQTGQAVYDAVHENGALPKLKELGLAQNVLGSAGACKLASLAFKGWKSLESLNLSQNQVGDSGVTAWHKALSAANVRAMLPHVAKVNLRMNAPTTATLRRLHDQSCPGALQL